MPKKLMLLIALCTPILGGCNQTTAPLRVINQTSYPNLQDITLPPGLELEAVTFDIPRDLSKQIIKNTPECESVLPANRTVDFWKVCGQYAALEGTNIYVGLSRQDFEALKRNLAKLQTREQQYRYRLNEVNRQRQDWRAANSINSGTMNLQAPTSDGVLRTIPGM